MVRTRFFALPLTAAIFMFVGCVGEEQETGEAAGEAPAAEQPAAMEEGPPSISGDTVTTESGLRYVLIEPGDGPSPEPGDVVRVHYTGWLTSGQKFDSSVDRGQPFSFTLGQGQVIPGWDQGIDSLHVGGEARLILPPELAYGPSGRGPIPPNSTLIFDVELLGIE